MRLFPFADAGCGRIHLRILSLGSAQFVKNVRGMWNGTYHDPATFSDFLLEEFRIECEKPVDFQIGGDSQGTRRIVEAKVTPTPIQLVDFGT
jgi:diacylglycerol kinase family enzyme